MVRFLAEVGKKSDVLVHATYGDPTNVAAFIAANVWHPYVTYAFYP